MANNDLDLEVKATGVWDYINENKKAKDIVVWVWKNFLSPRGQKLGLYMVVCMFLVNILGVISSYYAIRTMMDGLVMIVNNGKIQANYLLMYKGFAVFLAILVTTRVIGYLRNVFREYFFSDFSGRLNDKISRLYFQKSLGMHVSENNVLNYSNIKKGYENVIQLVNFVFIDLIDVVLVLLFNYMSIWPVNKTMGLMVTAMVVEHLVWSGYLNYRAMSEGYPIEKLWRSLNRYRMERWQHIERVKNNAKEEEELVNLNTRHESANLPDLKLWLWYCFWSFMRGLVCLAIFAYAIYYGLGKIIDGELSIGFFYPILSLCSSVLDNLWRVGDTERKIHYNLHSVGLLKEALELPVGITFRENAYKLPKDSPCRIEFDSVSYKFGDDPRTPPVLSRISFTIEPQTKVAIIGTSGVGKSTLTKLLLRYMDPKNGSIRIDGHDLREIDLDSWLNIIGYIPQKSQPLDGTIRYNALYGLSRAEAENISDEHLWDQARMLQVDFGERLIDGLNTKIGYNGIELSGGQNQRLMILAAVMKNPRFLIIDEATSSLDSTTEKLVQEGLQKALSRDCGALIVAHRLSTVRKCDKFIVFEAMNGSGGEIVGVGRSLEELYETCPQFRQLADDQELRI